MVKLLLLFSRTFALDFAFFRAQLALNKKFYFCYNDTMLSKLQNTIAGGTIIIGFFSVVSKLIGLFRDRLLASTFGASGDLDVYYAAFRLPDFVFNTLVLGALSAAFIPVFLELWNKDKESGWRVTNILLSVFAVVLTAAAVVMWIFARPLMYIIAPGFNPAQQALTADLTRIILPSIVIFGISNIISSLLNVFKRFIIYSLAPIMYNVGIVIGILFFVPYLGVRGLAWGVLVGALLHLLIQLPSAWKLGWNFKFDWDWRFPGVRKIIKLMIPRTFGLAVGQINQVVFTILASTMAAGSLAVFNLANNLQSVPIGILGVSMAVAAFPVLSEAWAKQDCGNFAVCLSVSIRRMLFVIIPFSVLLILLRAQIVRVVFGAGHFDWQDTIWTANTLGIFSLSLFAQVLIPLLARAFYARQDTRTPVIIAVISLLTNVGLAFWLMRIFPNDGIYALALSFSISSVINAALLFIILKLQVGWLDDKKMLLSLMKISFSSLAMGVVVWIMLRGALALPIPEEETFIKILTQAIIAGGVGVMVYIGLTFLLRSDELELIRVKAREAWKLVKRK